MTQMTQEGNSIPHTATFPYQSDKALLAASLIKRVCGTPFEEPKSRILMHLTAAEPRLSRPSVSGDDIVFRGGFGDIGGQAVTGTIADPVIARVMRFASELSEAANGVPNSLNASDWDSLLAQAGDGDHAVALQQAEAALGRYWQAVAHATSLGEILRQAEEERQSMAGEPAELESADREVRTIRQLCEEAEEPLSRLQAEADAATQAAADRAWAASIAAVAGRLRSLTPATAQGAGPGEDLHARESTQSPQAVLDAHFADPPQSSYEWATGEASIRRHFFLKVFGENSPLNLHLLTGSDTQRGVRLNFAELYKEENGRYAFEIRQRPGVAGSGYPFQVDEAAALTLMLADRAAALVSQGSRSQRTVVADDFADFTHATGAEAAWEDAFKALQDFSRSLSILSESETSMAWASQASPGGQALAAGEIAELTRVTAVLTAEAQAAGAAAASQVSAVLKEAAGMVEEMAAATAVKEFAQTVSTARAVSDHDTVTDGVLPAHRQRSGFGEDDAGVGDIALVIPAGQGWQDEGTWRVASEQVLGEGPTETWERTVFSGSISGRELLVTQDAVYEKLDTAYDYLLSDNPAVAMVFRVAAQLGEQTREAKIPAESLKQVLTEQGSPAGEHIAQALADMRDFAMKASKLQVLQGVVREAHQLLDVPGVRGADREAEVAGLDSLVAEAQAAVDLAAGTAQEASARFLNEAFARMQELASQAKTMKLADLSREARAQRAAASQLGVETGSPSH